MVIRISWFFRLTLGCGNYVAGFLLSEPWLCLPCIGIGAILFVQYTLYFLFPRIHGFTVNKQSLAARHWLCDADSTLFNLRMLSLKKWAHSLEHFHMCRKKPKPKFELALKSERGKMWGCLISFRLTCWCYSSPGSPFSAAVSTTAVSTSAKQTFTPPSRLTLATVRFSCQFHIVWS